MSFHLFTKYILGFVALSVPFALHADAAPAVPAENTTPAKKVPTKEELFSQDYIDRLSKTYGHLIQRSLNNPMIKLNPKAVMQGMQDGLDGKISPLSEKEYEEALTLIQQYSYDEQSNKNLQEAEATLKKHASESGIVSLDDGKILYKITQAGSGEVVTEDTIPTINYDANFSNGQKLGSSEQSGGPIEVKLNDTIPGFKKGILGMKVGEKRRIYIHPDLGFGKSGQLPNGLLIFDIEVTKISPKPAVDENADADDDEDYESTDEDDDDDFSTEDLMADNEDDEDDDSDEIDFNRATLEEQQDIAAKK